MRTRVFFCEVFGVVVVNPFVGRSKKHMNAKKIATQKGWVKEHKFGPFDAISALRLNVSTIDKRLVAALEDPSREKDGKIFPFVDIIGEDFFQFMMANLCKELDPPADGGGVGAVANGPIRMAEAKEPRDRRKNRPLLHRNFEGRKLRR